MKKGMVVVMDDGWVGRIESADSWIVAVLADGEPPDGHWCGSYRLVGPSAITVDGSTARVAWRPSPEQRRAAIVADIMRSALMTC